MVLDENDLCSEIMKGNPVWDYKKCIIDPSIDMEKLINSLEDPGSLMTWTFPENETKAVPEFDIEQQSHWHMPKEYRDMDIAEFVLGLCSTQEQLQRVGQELLLFQEKKLFDLLRYLKYLVDTMQQNNVIWGVGRGSSVASYVLYLLGVHRVDSMFYDLDVREFLR